MASWRSIFRRDCTAAAILALVVIPLAGCAAVRTARIGGGMAAPATAPSPAGTSIAAMETYAIPIALNWDKDPQPDGVELRVFFFAKNKSLAQPMTRGSLRVAAYDGRLDKTSSNHAHPRAHPHAHPHARPLHQWTLTPADMAAHIQHGLAGTGYQLALDWGRDVPRRSSVTVIASYIPPGDHAVPISAAPVTITVKAAN